MKRKNLLERITTQSIGKTLRALPAMVRNTWYHWRNARLDRKYGIDTQGIIDDMDALAAPPANRLHANGYEGIQIDVFERLLNDLQVNMHCTQDRIRTIKRGQDDRNNRRQGTVSIAR